MLRVRDTKKKAKLDHIGQERGNVRGEGKDKEVELNHMGQARGNMRGGGEGGVRRKWNLITWNRKGEI